MCAAVVNSELPNGRDTGHDGDDPAHPVEKHGRRSDEGKHTLNPNAAKQKISDGQANPEFQKNWERLKAERLAREAGLKAKEK